MSYSPKKIHGQASPPPLAAPAAVKADGIQLPCSLPLGLPGCAARHRTVPGAKRLQKRGFLTFLAGCFRGLWGLMELQKGCQKGKSYEIWQVIVYTDIHRQFMHIQKLNPGFQICCHNPYQCCPRLRSWLVNHREQFKMSSVKLGPVLAKAFLELVRHLQVTRKKMGKFMDICQIEFVWKEVRG